MFYHLIKYLFMSNLQLIYLLLNLFLFMLQINTSKSQSIDNSTIIPKNIINFEISDIHNETSNNYYFYFVLNGNIKENIYLKPLQINIELDLKEIDKKVGCIFYIKKNNTALLQCNLKINDNKNQTILSFKKSKVELENGNILNFVNIDKIFLINKAMINDETFEKFIKRDIVNVNQSKTHNDKYYTVIIIIIIIFILFIILAIVFLKFYNLNNKRNKNKKKVKRQDSSNDLEDKKNNSLNQSNSSNININN